MFDTYNTRSSIHEVTKQIHEHRAPTDESVRLLREMEQKAKDEIFKSVRLDNSEITGVVHFMRDHLTTDLLVAIQFSLNGKRYIHNSRLKEWKSSEEKIEQLKEEFAETISTNILLNLFRNEDYERIFK